MNENTYDHIDKYLNARINDPNSPKIRDLIGDFAILWNQYERKIYHGHHHIKDVREMIKRYHLEQIR